MNKMKLEKPSIPAPQGPIQGTIADRRSQTRALPAAVAKHKPSGAVTYTLSNGADVWSRSSHRTTKAG